MNTKTLLASLAGTMLLASPVVASAATPAKPATSTTKDACKNLKGAALKSCKDAQKKAAKTK